MDINIETPSPRSVEGYLVQSNFGIQEMQKTMQDLSKGAFSFCFLSTFGYKHKDENFADYSFGANPWRCCDGILFDDQLFSR